jgi:hypothetical protein
VSATTEADLARALRSGTGIIELPAGVVIIHSELVIPEGSSSLEIHGHSSGSVLQASSDFKGRAIIVAESASHLRLKNFRIDGNRSKLEVPIGLPPSNVSFARFYSNNGILLEKARHVTIQNLFLTHVTSFPLLISASSDVLIEDVVIEDSGSLNEQGRNNTSGGILLEEGAINFEVRRCAIRRIRGNAIWTHSNYHSLRNANGLIAGNSIAEVARDAIQVGHATNIKVERNTGQRIGYPINEVDVESIAIPVALDTAGNVDHSLYVENQFEDVNGQCIDLDGFHHGEVRNNSCVSRKPFDQYPFAHYGIVLGNSNPDMRSENVTVTGNTIIGAAYGGVFLIGSHHQILENRFEDLNRAHCTGDPTRPRCNYAPDEPGMLRSGIYLGRGAARPAETQDNVIRDNQVSGFGMAKWCIATAPGVSLSSDQIQDNRCTDTSKPR